MGCALQKLTDATNELGGRWLVTADHGNAEGMVQRDKKGEPIKDDGVPIPLTSHTLSPVSPLAVQWLLCAAWLLH